MTKDLKTITAALRQGPVRCCVAQALTNTSQAPVLRGCVGALKINGSTIFIHLDGEAKKMAMCHSSDFKRLHIPQLGIYRA